MSTAQDKVKAARGGPNRRAAPAGGALRGGRGCLFFLSLPIFLSSLIAAVCTALPALAQDPDKAVAVPSGQPVFLLEYVDETATDDAIFRARYIAPELAGLAEAFDVVLTDMEHLCNRQVIPNVEAAGLSPARIVVSLSAEPLDLGVIAPEVVQIFESYTITDGTCMWEIY